MFSIGGGEYPTGIPVDDYEPNNSPADATDLPLGATPGLGPLTIHKSGTKADSDYFRIYAPTTGLMSVEIFFSHAAGDLNLTAYNSGNGIIGSANSSTNNTNRETLAMAVQAGQTYYIKVGGATNPGYDIAAHHVSANFNWNMPSRFGGAAGTDQYGLPIINNTADYARPNQIDLNGKTISRFPVKFSVGEIAGTGAAYNWTVSGTASEAGGAPYSANFSGAFPTTDLPNGNYTATLTTTVNGTSVTSSQQIAVRNYLLVAIGDSYSSGEGNPHATQTYDFLGFTSSGAKWAQGGDDVQSRFNRMAHRSSKAAVAQAALQIENEDPHSSVTFVFLSATGARIDWGVLAPKDSGEVAAPGEVPSQLVQLRDIAGNRHIDALTLSIGGNDIGFGDIFAELVKADAITEPWGYLDHLEEAFSAAEQKIATLAGKYAQLNNALKQFDIGQVLMTEYPDLTKDGNGNFAEYLGDIAPGLEADAGELEKAVNRLMAPLVGTMRVAAKNFGWTYVDGISEQFASGHHGGYGQILRSAQDSAYQQGPLSHVGNLANPWATQDTKGMMHPIGAGLDIVRDRILAKLRAPELVVDQAEFSDSSMIYAAQSGYTITVRNASMLNWSSASTVNVYVSPDGNITTGDFKLIEIPLRSLAPGESITFTGVFPNQSDPYRTPDNTIHLGAVIDPYGNVVEANELNNAPIAGSPMIKKITSDKDWTSFFGHAEYTAPWITLGGAAVNGAIGYDEQIGGYDLDSFTFVAGEGQRWAFDVDSYDNLDTFIRISRFNIDGTWTAVAFNDNGAAPGENPNEQSYLDHTFADAGQYVITIGHRVNQNASQISNVGRQHGSYGHYSITTERVTMTTPPSVTGSGHDVDSHRAWVRFSEDVRVSIVLGALKLLNRTTGQGYALPSTRMSWDAGTNTAWFELRGDLADGDYRLTLPASAFANAQGTLGTGDASVDFFMLAGDADHNRKVDFNDLLVLAKNFNQTGRTFAQGNFDRSTNGAVDFNDLLVLAKGYGKTLAAPAALKATTTSATRTRNPFSSVLVI